MVRFAPILTALWFRACVILVLLSFAAPARAWTHSTFASSAAVLGDTTAIEAEPGQRVTVVFTLGNTERDRRRLEALPVLPSGWRLISGGGTTDIAPGDEHPQFIQFLVPARTTPGVYAVLLEIRVAGESRLRRADSLRVRVRLRRSLEVEALDAPRFAMAGADYRLKFMVRNRGNIDTRVRIEVVEHAGFASRPSWRDTLLAPGETRNLDVVVQTRTGPSRVIRHLVELRAIAAERTKDDSMAIAGASTTVLVVPQNGDAAPRFHRIPMHARVVTTPSKRTPGSRGETTGELAGGGQIAEGSRSRVDFRLRASSRDERWSRNDGEYQFSITSPRLGLQLGDHLFTLSPLTEPGRHATGVAARAEAAGLSIRGFVARNRHALDGSGARAGALGYELNRAARVTANYLERIGPDSGRLFSVRGQLSPSPLASLDLEAARGLDGAAGKPALTVQLSGWQPRLSYRLQHVDIPSEFPGSVRGVQSDAGSFAVRVVQGFRVHASASRQRNTTPFNLLRASRGTDLRSSEVGIGWGDWLSLAHVLAAARDSNIAGDKSVNESLIRLRASANVGPGSVHSTVTLGDVQTTADGARHRTFDAVLQAALRLRRGNQLSGYVQHTSGPRWYAPNPQELVTAGFTARLNPLRRITVDLAASGTRRDAPQRHDYLSLEGAANYQSPIGHVISISMRSRSLAGMSVLDAPIFQVAYTVPLGLPIGYSRSGSRVVGRVYDSESGKGVANALVLVGDHMAMTDNEGRIAMSGLQAGTQYLQLELSGAASDHVAMQPLPLPLSTHPGQPARVNVALVRGTRMTGKVRRFAPASPASWDGSRAALTEVVGMPGVVVAMMRDGDVHRRLTDAEGEFDAAGLRPGRWTITIDAGELPAHHYVAQPSVTIDVAPGGTATADFDVLPRKRTVVMIDQGKVVAEDARVSRSDRAEAPAVMPPSPANASPSRAASSDRPAEPTTPAPRSEMGKSYYVVRESDRNLENVAIWMYNDVTLWPKLWVANRDHLRGPGELQQGMLLVIPPRAPLTPAEIRARDDYEAARKP